MSERRREALRLHRFEGLTYEEIARRLSVSPTAVRKHIAAALAQIAARLAEADDGRSDPAG
jgi:RNA polymerase sigma-70 factor (ECF subfamily)